MSQRHAAAQDRQPDDPVMLEGQPVSDGQVQAWADEAEAGYDPAMLRRRGRRTLD